MKHFPQDLMSNRLSTLLVLGVSLASPPALTFEVATHAAFTQSAVDKARSVSDPSLFGLERLGILEINNLYQRDVFGSRFFDFVGGVVTERFADSPGFVPPGYEMNVFGFANLVPQFLTLGGWVVRGAIREDDVYWDFRSKNPRNNPQDDLCTQNVQPCYRVLNHFFDPYNNRPLSVEAPLIGEIRLPVERSPDWAIGAVDSFASNAQQNPARSNHFSIFDAREAMYRALTLKKTNPFAPGYVSFPAE